MVAIIPESECTFSFSRSGGAGGQNVNKVSTRVSLSWDFSGSRVLSDHQKNRLAASDVFAARLSSDGRVVIHEQRGRTQGLNRQLAMEKLNELVALALRPVRKRVRTRVGRGQKESRLQSKKQRSRKLKERRVAD